MSSAKRAICSRTSKCKASLALRYTQAHMRFVLLPVLVLGSLMLTSPASAQHLSADGAAQTFDFVSEQYFDQVYFKYNPTAGTQAGFHQYDAQLEDYSEQALAKQKAALHAFEKKIVAIPAEGLDAPQAADRDILLNSIRSTLLTLEV